jgi:hypothetical protein
MHSLPERERAKLERLAGVLTVVQVYIRTSGHYINGAISGHEGASSNGLSSTFASYWKKEGLELSERG